MRCSWVLTAVATAVVAAASLSGCSASTISPTVQSFKAPANTPIVFPPKTLAESEALAATGDPSDVNVFHEQDNGMVACFNFGRSIVVPSSLTGQALAATLLNYYFHLEQANPNTTGCGGLSINAYNNVSQASGNSPLGGESTAGNVQLFISDTNPKYQVTVDLGPADIPTEQFSFNY
jgi:hypothetical protein